MAMALTVSQMFLGAVSIGIGLMRGTDAYTAFHHETNLGHANYGASKLAHDHGRSANIVVNNNVVMTAIMGPRMGVESDNITMDGNAMIACPTCPNSPTCKVCQQYQQNKPRAVTKLTWVRAKQQMLWSALGKMDGEVDKLASTQAQGTIQGDVKGVDPKVSISFDDPSQSGDIWGGSAKSKSCDDAKNDTLQSPVLGHAFPILISPNLLEGMPKMLVQAMPGMLCGGGAGGMGGMGGMGGGGGGGGGGGSGGDDSSSSAPSLPQIKSVADQTTDDCNGFETQMKSAVAAARGGTGGAVDGQIEQLGSGNVKLPAAVQPYVTCQTASASSPLKLNGGGYAFRNSAKQVVSCTFDRAKCMDQQLQKNSDAFLRSELGLPPSSSSGSGSSSGGGSNPMSSMGSMMGGGGGGIGSDEPRKPAAGGSSPSNFCACATTKKPIDDTVIGITDAIRTIASFGQVGQSEVLRQDHSYKSCGKWYFPDKKGTFASVEEDQQPFVGAWKWALVKECQGGGS